MRHEPEPARFTMHPVVWGASLMVCAFLWCGIFKILAALCRATLGAGQ